MGCALFKPAKALRMACAGLLLGTGGLLMAAGPGAQDATDVRLEIRIVTLYAQRPELRTSSLVASVQAGRATLSGTVDEDYKRRLAAQVARAVEGIDSVDNRIRLPAPPPARSLSHAPAAPSPVVADVDAPWCGAPAGLAGDDGWITTKVILALLHTGDNASLAIAVSTCNGVVSLRGQVSSDDERTRAVALALDVPGVRSVVSQALASALCGGKRGSAPTRWPWVAIVSLPIPRNGARAG
ncbi:BON domain-containing protein [Pseudomonas sp. 30_B]|uniref:BON domain-containing protein n=1 Tax=Pseudomonas sp. 30_B TaxID=2813575 RepID=UPI001A9F9C5B|nr:BON domain-containing protein [Pseudomonas sp. 30_B]